MANGNAKTHKFMSVCALSLAGLTAFGSVFAVAAAATAPEQVTAEAAHHYTEEVKSTVTVGIRFILKSSAGYILRFEILRNSVVRENDCSVDVYKAHT